MSRVLRSLAPRLQLLNQLLMRHGHFLSLVLLAVVIGAAWVFVELADELGEGELHAIDLAILELFRNAQNPSDPIGPPWFEVLMRDATALGGVLVLSLLVVSTVLALWMERHRRAAAWMAAAAVGALALSTLFKNLFMRERPDIVTDTIMPLGYSFPSGHSMLSAAVYLTLGALLTHVVPHAPTRTFVLFMAFLLAFVTGISRIYLGVHFPSDVLAGWTLGLAWAALCWLVAWNLHDR